MKNLSLLIAVLLLTQPAIDARHRHCHHRRVVCQPPAQPCPSPVPTRKKMVAIPVPPAETPVAPVVIPDNRIMPTPVPDHGPGVDPLENYMPDMDPVDPEVEARPSRLQRMMGYVPRIIAGVAAAAFGWLLWNLQQNKQRIAGQNNQQPPAVVPPVVVPPAVVIPPPQIVNPPPANVLAAQDVPAAAEVDVKVAQEQNAVEALKKLQKNNAKLLRQLERQRAANRLLAQTLRNTEPKVDLNSLQQPNADAAVASALANAEAVSEQIPPSPTSSVAAQQDEKHTAATVETLREQNTKLTEQSDNLGAIVVMQGEQLRKQASALQPAEPRRSFGQAQTRFKPQNYGTLTRKAAKQVAAAAAQENNQSGQNDVQNNNGIHIAPKSNGPEGPSANPASRTPSPEAQNSAASVPITLPLTTPTGKTWGEHLYVWANNKKDATK